MISSMFYSRSNSRVVVALVRESGTTRRLYHRSILARPLKLQNNNTNRFRFALNIYFPSSAPSTTMSTAAATTESPAVLAAKAALASIDLSGYDAEQSRLMDEKCILVDEEDRAIGAMDKKTCKHHRHSQRPNVS